MTQTSAASDEQTRPDEARQVNRTTRSHDADVLALERMVYDHHAHVLRTVRRLLGWRGDADDVAQEVFLAALRQHRTFRGDSSLRTWLTAIAIRRCRTEQRKWWKRWRIGTRSATTEPSEPAAGHDAIAEEVRSAVRRLPASEREVVVLYYLEEMPAADVAKLTGTTVGAVNVRLHRARKRLGELLAGMSEER